MSELKGQILGIILTLVMIGTISAVITAAVDNLNGKIKDEVKETTGKEVIVEDDLLSNYLTY